MMTLSDLPQTMQAVLLNGHGDYDQLTFRRDVPVPQPGPGEVLIKVEAAAINNTDINTRIGWYSKTGRSDDAAWAGEAIRFPLIQGADVCGTVVAIGDQVDSKFLRQRVLVEPSLWELHAKTLKQPAYFGSDCHGGFAQFTCVAARHAFVVRSELSALQLAALPCSWSTAENLLTRSQVQTNDRVLITGASGGVGSAAVQLAKLRGAIVVAQTSDHKAEQLHSYGADQTVDREADLLATLGQNSVDVVIDLVAGPQWVQLLEVLKPFGRYAVSGAIAGPMVELDVRTLYLKDLTLYGCTILEPQVFPRLIQLLEQQQLHPLVDAVFELEQLVEAQKMFLTRKHIGKIVIDMLAGQ